MVHCVRVTLWSMLRYTCLSAFVGYAVAGAFGYYVGVDAALIALGVGAAATATLVGAFMLAMVAHCLSSANRLIATGWVILSRVAGDGGSGGDEADVEGEVVYDAAARLPRVSVLLD